MIEMEKDGLSDLIRTYGLSGQEAELARDRAEELTAYLAGTGNGPMTVRVHASMVGSPMTDGRRSLLFAWLPDRNGSRLSTVRIALPPDRFVPDGRGWFLVRLGRPSENVVELLSRNGGGSRPVSVEWVVRAMTVTKSVAARKYMGPSMTAELCARKYIAGPRYAYAPDAAFRCMIPDAAVDREADENIVYFRLPVPAGVSPEGYVFIILEPWEYVHDGDCTDVLHLMPDPVKTYACGLYDPGRGHVTNGACPRLSGADVVRYAEEAAAGKNGPWRGSDGMEDVSAQFAADAGRVGTRRKEAG